MGEWSVLVYCAGVGPKEHHVAPELSTHSRVKGHPDRPKEYYDVVPVSGPNLTDEDRALISQFWCKECLAPYQWVHEPRYHEDVAANG